MVRVRLALVSVFACLAGCSASKVPDPRSALNAYVEAERRGDADALYEMLSIASKHSHSREYVRQAVAEQRDEHATRADTLAREDARLEAIARLRFDDGEEAILEFREGRFWVCASGALPGGTRTPVQALDALRRVLARRSYAGLMRVLSPQTRAAVDRDLRSLVEGLEHPETLRVELHGDSATIEVPGGHRVRLKREGGLWRVDDFD
jgi:hypothetical protein